jgi:hypothetical protein
MSNSPPLNSEELKLILDKEDLTKKDVQILMDYAKYADNLNEEYEEIPEDVEDNLAWDFYLISQRLRKWLEKKYEQNPDKYCFLHLPPIDMD